MPPGWKGNTARPRCGTSSRLRAGSPADLWGQLRVDQRGSSAGTSRRIPLPEICNQVPVHPGDVFSSRQGRFTPSGRGSSSPRCSRTSNTTYRVSDYGRLGPDGKPRALHVDKAVDVTVTVPPQIPYGAVGWVSPVPGGSVRPLASCGLFTAELLTVEGQMRVGCPKALRRCCAWKGEGALLWEDGELPIGKGTSIFLPAGMAVPVKGACGCCAAGYKGGPAMPTLHVVLIEPEIPQNTGNISRTCAATGCHLHLVGPLGFSIDDRQLKRAGLDYWHLLDITTYENRADFFAKNTGPFFILPPKAGPFIRKWFIRMGRIWFSAKKRPACRRRCSGRTGSGVSVSPCSTMKRPGLNLSNTVAVGVYEVLRQWGVPVPQDKGAADLNPGVF